uniref:D-lactate dehydrogenase (cytochrome) n=2 Tax=Chromera velia CCMP2878 TaxID=1169474 RepID=A0A0K6S6L6_9ALVE|eukprot:Cvel_16422.t1-p1 / transcript=Cvel_16422.t1 / gene=Cvel_16422 / organism=Chromera_velia_CCMP2878 / gene_product=Probable D-lactate dehydrogenase, mitochondrial, putative / transcript_product=Probable D-lactate dehydrogenase, mitochondrial, putative / location=Cvel_scaffold1265:361-8074(+) / protein_length=539 / sequence_SO=supercontig / SO=protein_coding / is_pseudo=false
MDRLTAVADQVLKSFSDETNTRKSLEGRRALTPFLLEELRKLPSFSGRANECVLTSEEEVEKHSYDHSHHLPARPEVVVYPESTETVSEVMKFCYTNKIPVTPCGARTGLEGGCIPIAGGVALNLSRMNRVLQVFHDELQVHVQAGIRKNAFNDLLSKEKLLFQVDPASNPSLGGMAATGSSGTLCCKYGTMKENVVSLVVVMPDGAIVDTRRRTRKSSTGYDLTNLMMGQEGTLAVVCELIVKVIPVPKGECSALLVFRDLDPCSRLVVLMRQQQLNLSRCELLGKQTVETLLKFEERKREKEKKRATGRQKKEGAKKQHFSLPSPAKPTLLIQVHAASPQAAEAEINQAVNLARQEGVEEVKVATEPHLQEALWDLRRAAYFACLSNRQHMIERKAKDVRMLNTDVCVPLPAFPELIGATERDFAEVAQKGGPFFVCNIFGHAADGNFHCIVLFDHGNSEEVRSLEALERRMWARCLAAGGTVSGEHGVGLGKVGALTAEHGEAKLRVMRQLKGAVDERGIMNPGKVLPSLKTSGDK